MHFKIKASMKVPRRKLILNKHRPLYYSRHVPFGWKDFLIIVVDLCLHFDFQSLCIDSLKYMWCRWQHVCWTRKKIGCLINLLLLQFFVSTDYQNWSLGWIWTSWPRLYEIICWKMRSAIGSRILDLQFGRGRLACVDINQLPSF